MREGLDALFRLGDTHQVQKADGLLLGFLIRQ